MIIQFLLFQDKPVVQDHWKQEKSSLFHLFKKPKDVKVQAAHCFWHHREKYSKQGIKHSESVKKRAEWTMEETDLGQSEGKKVLTLNVL